MKYVGFDGKSYFCLRCGKAGFTSEMAVIGHLRSCPAKRYARVRFYHAPNAHNGGAQGAQSWVGSGDITLDAAQHQQHQHHQQYTQLARMYSELLERQERLEQYVYNEMTHKVMAMSSYSPGGLEWWQWLLLGFIAGLIMGSRIQSGKGGLAEYASKQLVGAAVRKMLK